MRTFYKKNYLFLDALASLDLKLSVGQSVSEGLIFFLQLAHLRVFQIYSKSLEERQMSEIKQS